MLKAIQFCDRFNRFVQKEEKTSILLVTPNSCCSFYLNGNILVDCFEEPLAVKSFSTEEVYSTISKMASNSISKNKPQSLLIISETDEVNSELLSQRLNFEGEIDCINKSINANDQFIDVAGDSDDIDSNMISYMTIEAVGAAVSDFDNYPLNLNFLPQERINNNIVNVLGYEVDFRRYISVLVISTVLAGLIVCFIVNFIIENRMNSMSETGKDSKRKIEVFKKRIGDNEKTKTKNIFPVLTKILENNKSVIDVYSALSTEIPESVYIKKFVTNEQGGIGILGEAKTSESVDAFVKGLREKDDGLILSKLSVNSKDDIIPAKIPNGFTFEIKTSDIDVSLNLEEEMIRANIQNTMSNINNRNRQQTSPASSTSPAKRTGSRRNLTPPPSPII